MTTAHKEHENHVYTKLLKQVIKSISHCVRVKRLQYEKKKKKNQNTYFWTALNRQTKIQCEYLKNFFLEFTFSNTPKYRCHKKPQVSNFYFILKLAMLYYKSVNVQMGTFDSQGYYSLTKTYTIKK